MAAIATLQGITMSIVEDMKRDIFPLNMLHESNFKYLIFENWRMQLAMKDECTSDIYVSRKKKEMLESSLTLCAHKRGRERKIYKRLKHVKLTRSRLKQGCCM